MSNKAKTSTPKPDGKPALTPKLRFPGFLWQTVREVKLKDVTAESTTRNGETLPTTAVMGVSKAEGIVPMEERIISSDIARYKLVQRDWFAYNPMRLNIGSIARWQGESDILVSPDYVVFKCLDEGDSGIDPAFLDQFRRSVAWKNFVTHGGDGGVRVRIYYKDIGRLALILPTLAEQKKIAECLNSVDELIAAQARKLDALKTHKKGLMQQLFPREGETQPRLRFPEFQNAGEWVETNMGQRIIIKGRIGYRGYTVQDIVNAGDGAISLSPSNITESGTLRFEKATYITWAKYQESPEIMVKRGHTLLVKTGSTYGKVAFVRDLPMECTVNPQIVVLKPHSIEPYFLFLLVIGDAIQAKIQATVVGGAIPTLSQESISKFEIRIPAPPEQQRIADCLTSLDNLIAAQTQELEARGGSVRSDSIFCF